MTYPKTVPGDNLGIDFPTTIEALQELGVDFLTAAFRASGVLSADNSVAEITEFEEFYGGGMGRKLLLSVRYEKPGAQLAESLFVKFPRDFGDPLRDVFTPVMEPEVRFALLSRRNDFPVAVPACYFADYHAESVSGLLITDRVAYGVEPNEPHIDKCLDYRLGDPLNYYRALVIAIARLAGFHKAGRFGEDTESLFPYDPDDIKETDLIPYSAADLQDKLEKLREFAKKYPQLLPAHLRDETFLDEFALHAPMVLEREKKIKRYLNNCSDLIALCHWNANIDNAWFWRDDQGELHAGLLDWGSVSQMNVAQAFFGVICSGETHFLDQHRESLMELFADEYHRSGGPKLDMQEFKRCVDLAVAVLGVAWMIDAPSLAEAEVPDLHLVKDRFDPRLENNFLPRAQIQIMTVFLNEWWASDIGKLVARFS